MASEDHLDENNPVAVWRRSDAYVHLVGKYGECLTAGKHSAITDFGVPKPTDTFVLSYCNYCEHVFDREISLEEAAILSMLKTEIPIEPSIDDLLEEMPPPDIPDDLNS